MYYFVNFTYKDEIMEADPDVTLLPCEWVVKADSKEEAIEQIKKDIEVDEILEIREISAEERIEREQSDLLEMIKWDYLYRRCANMSIREYSKVQKEFESNLEIKYLALVLRNRSCSAVSFSIKGLSCFTPFIKDNNL